MIPSDLTDAELGARAVEGDREAFAELFARHEPGLLNVAYRMTGSREDAADITQEAFLRVFARLGDLEGREVHLAPRQNVEAGEDAEERLLGDVGGVLAVAGEAVGDVEEAPLVTREQLGEGVAVAREGLTAERVVGEVGRAHGACGPGHGSSGSSSPAGRSRRKSQKAA